MHVNRQYELYPKLFFSGELIEGKTYADFWAKRDTFIDDLQTEFRNGIASFAGITLIELHYDNYTEPTVTPIPNTTNQYEVYPEFLFTMGNVTDDQDLDTRWQAFIEDCETALRNLLANMPNTTILKVHYHTADGQTVETVLIKCLNHRLFMGLL